MENYIVINGEKTYLTEAQVESIKGCISIPNLKLADIPAGETFKLGNHEFIVLEQIGDTTAILRKDLLPNQRFGSDNNFKGSGVGRTCNKFATELSAIIGEDNIVEHTVDLTSDDGLKDYGTIKCRCSLLTSDLYRRYVDILDKFNPDEWWWLATAHSTKRHDNDRWVKCVSPSGCVGNVRYDDGDYGVRPFCVLKSTIFVSK